MLSHTQPKSAKLKLRGSDPAYQEEKMLERLGLVLLGCVLAFAFAPYFYALGGL
jgi:hypothetical protein